MPSLAARLNHRCFNGNSVMPLDFFQLATLIRDGLESVGATPAERVQRLLDGPLASHITDGDQREQWIAEIIRRDQEFAWTRDEAGSVITERKSGTALTEIQQTGPILEDYLAGLPSFEPSHDTILGLVCHEYCVRYRAGARPQSQEYLRRFPRIAEAYQPHLATLEEQLAVECSIRSLLADPNSFDSMATDEAVSVATQAVGVRDSVAEPLLDVLKRVRPFAELSQSARSAVAGAAQICDFEAGEVLVRQGAAPDCLLIILAGEVQVTVVDGDRTHVLGRLDKHTVVGEIGLLTHERRSANVIALTAGRLALISRGQYEQLAGRYLRLNISMSELVSERVGNSTIDALFGKTVGAYRLQQRLGQGGMGIVYSATHLERGRVAIKMLRHNLVFDRHVRLRFEQESSIVQALDHTNILRVFEDFEAFGTLFIAMELCGGQTLSDVIQSFGPLPPDILKASVGQLCAALCYAHESGIAHRDLKPANVLIGGDGFLKLSDFGLARQLVDQGPELTSYGQVLGTPRYMAPEQMAGERGDEKSDYYSLSCVIYELATGHPVFRETRFNDLIAERHGWTLPPQEQFKPDLDAEIYEQLQCGFHERPDDRTVDIHKMAQWASPVDWGCVLTSSDNLEWPTGAPHEQNLV